MPMIQKKDGSESYAMNPSFGRAVEAAREKDAPESKQGTISRVEFERLDDGTITSTCHYKAAAPGQENEPAKMVEPLRSSHAGAEEAAEFLRSKLV